MPARRYMVSPQGGGVPTAQTAAVAQTTVKDPATGNRYDVFNTSSSSFASPTTGISQAAYISGNIAGNALLCMAGCANDFGTGPDPAGNKVIACSDPVNGAWTQVGEQLNNLNDCNFDARAWVKFNAQPLLSTSWNGTGAVGGGGVLTIGSGSGAFRLGQRINGASTPAVGIAGGETIIVSLLSGSLGAAGSTYQLGGGIGGTTFASQAMTTTDVVLVQRSQTVSSNFADYPGTVLQEIFGTDGATTYFGGANPALAVGTDSVSTGNIVMAAGPGLLIGFGFNGGVNEGSGGTFCPAAGTGFTNSQAILTYDQAQPICRIEWQHFASLGTRAATWSSSTASNYLAMAVGFRDHP